MLKIRMQRTGRKHSPVFRVIVAEHTTGPKSGKIVEKVGWYDAKQGKKEFDSERIKYWIGKGALPSDTVHNFLVDEKVIEGKKINVLPKKKPIETVEKTPEILETKTEVTPQEDKDMEEPENKKKEEPTE